MVHACMTADCQVSSDAQTTHDTARELLNRNGRDMRERLTPECPKLAPYGPR
jgi:hypothetical protein